MRPRRFSSILILQWAVLYYCIISTGFSWGVMRYARCSGNLADARGRDRRTEQRLKSETKMLNKRSRYSGKKNLRHQTTAVKDGVDKHVCAGISAATQVIEEDCKGGGTDDDEESEEETTDAEQA